MLGCVAAGIGITLLPEAVVAPARRDGRINTHPLPSEQSRVPTVFIRRRDAFVSSARARFVECAQRTTAGQRDGVSAGSAGNERDSVRC
ncbi:MAG: hypothetical protein HY329_28260 [Chloroflexi bacterium]|nr:hypothetical protein [Chloroflexota bacterium]